MVKLNKIRVVVFAMFACFATCYSKATTNATTKKLYTVSNTEFNLPIQKEQRNIRVRLGIPTNTDTNLPQLIIMATGLYSQMDKPTQIELAKNFQQAGFATLQFNFMAHGTQQNKSDGNIEDVTLSSSITDLTSVWGYAQKELSKKTNTNDIVIAANSYGALVSLMALEQNLISPESMVLVAPFSLDKAKPWILPLRLFAKIMPNYAAKTLKLSRAMLTDFLKYHTKAMSNKQLLGNTAVYFFTGTQDKLSPASAIENWCKTFNSQQLSDVKFVNNIQAHHRIYNNVPHFNIPDTVSKDITKRSIDFIKKTHFIKSK